MSQYIKGEVIKALREKNKMTQAEIAEKIGVSDKAVSKWETGRGLPDITLVEPIAEALGLSVGELFAGEQIINSNVASNMRRASLYVCPICGNMIQSAGDVAVSCCGVTLPALEAEDAAETGEAAKAEAAESGTGANVQRTEGEDSAKSPQTDSEHCIEVESIEDELYVSMDHPMTKDHYISFIIYRTGDRIDTVKLYPEGNAECRFFRRGRGEVLAYCNRHGLFRIKV